MTEARTHTFVDSPIGPLALVASSGVLCGLYMEDHRGRPYPTSFGDRVGAGFEEAAEQLGEYFSGERRSFTVATRAWGCAFDRQVWGALAGIPYGETRSYGQLASELGLGREGARAVGAANGRNPLSIVVPCHRVVGRDGRLVGFGGGLDRKRFLLDLERFGP